jgi:hypothetical protein
MLAKRYQQFQRRLARHYLNNIDANADQPGYVIRIRVRVSVGHSIDGRLRVRVRLNDTNSSKGALLGITSRT